MNVLIIHQHFNSPYVGGPLRSYYLATALVEAGIGVRVITGSRVAEYEVKTIDGIEVHYLPIDYDNSFGFYKRGWSFISFVNRATQLASTLENIDLCYAISTPITVGLIALRLKRKRNIPFIFEVGDLWPDAPIELGFVRNPILKSILFRLEKKIYNAASSIVGLSLPIQQTIQRKAPGKAVHLIPNMADTDFYKPSSRDHSQEPFTIAYLGALGYANDLELVLKSALQCQSENLAVRFVICGEGAQRQKLQTHCQEMGLTNVLLKSFTNREGVRTILEESDAVFISYRTTKILETGSPNKYFDGLAAGKLIMVNFGGWIREEIETNAAGFFAMPGNGRDFTSKLRLFLDDPDKLKQYQRSARALAETRYSRRLLSARFVDVVSQLPPK